MAPETSTTAPFDPHDPLHVDDPEPHLAAARRSCPVSHPRAGLAVLAADVDVRAAFTDVPRFSSHGNFSLDGPAELPVPMITMTDPPEHTELRTRLREWFGPPALRRLEPRVRELVAEVVAGLPDRGELDLYDACIRNVPARVVFAFLGLPRGDWALLQDLSDRVAEGLPGPVHLLPEFAQLNGRLAELIAGRRAAGPAGRDVLDGLVHAGPGRPELTPEETLTHVLHLVMAGTDTTRSASTNMLYELLRAPELWARVRDDRSLLPVAVEESLRHDAPIQYVLRTARVDTDVQGCPIAAAEKVLLSVQSANRDEQAWGPDAAAYSLDRAAPARHLSFGQGIHACLGAPLARIEVRVLLEALLDRYPAMRLADGYRWEKIHGPMLRRPRRLDVVLG